MWQTTIIYSFKSILFLLGIVKRLLQIINPSSRYAFLEYLYVKCVFVNYVVPGTA